MENGYYLKLIYQTVQEYNIIPLTSVCQQSCLFCSHHFNPEDIEVYSGGHLDKGMVFSLFDYINKDRPVYIGESATRIIEGEPFNHPDWQEILREFRLRFPETPLRITTSAAGLNKDDIGTLVDLDSNGSGGLRLTVSVNLLDLEKREEVLGAGSNKQILEILKELNRNEIFVETSFVAIPGVTGWDELENSIYKVSQFENIKLARIMMAGYSKFADADIKNKFLVDRLKLQKQVEDLNDEISIPLIFEPAVINDLQAEILGIIINTPAWSAGLKKGDIIKEISGEKVFSRVDAFNKFKESLENRNKFNLLINRKGRSKELTVNSSGWGRNDYTGLVMANDFSFKEFSKFKNKFESSHYARVLILTSKLAEDRLNLIAEILEDEVGIEIDVMVVASNYFGGNIGSAGLLVVDDYKLIANRVNQLNYDLIITSSALFDIDGRDLKGALRSDLLDLFSTELFII